MENLFKLPEESPLTQAQNIIRGKWTIEIIFHLSENPLPLRFSELREKLKIITDANLTKELRLLEKYGMVHREIYKVVPPKVEYSLTDLGLDFLPVIKALEKWGKSFQEKHNILNGQLPSAN